MNFDPKMLNFGELPYLIAFKVINNNLIINLTASTVRSTGETGDVPNI